MEKIIQIVSLSLIISMCFVLEASCQSTDSLCNRYIEGTFVSLKGGIVTYVQKEDTVRRWLDGRIYDYPKGERVGNKVVFRQENKYGVVNQKNEQLLPPVFEKIRSIGGSLFEVTRYGKKAIVDSSNELISPYTKYAHHYYRINKDSVIVFARKQQWLSTKSGSLIKLPYRVGKEMMEDLIIKYENNKYGLINNHLAEVLPSTFDKIRFRCGKYIEVTTGNQIKILDSDLNEVCSTDLGLQNCHEDFLVFEGDRVNQNTGKKEHAKYCFSLISRKWLSKDVIKVWRRGSWALVITTKKTKYLHDQDHNVMYEYPGDELRYLHKMGDHLLVEDKERNTFNYYRRDGRMVVSDTSAHTVIRQNVLWARIPGETYSKLKLFYNDTLYPLEQRNIYASSGRWYLTAIHDSTYLVDVVTKDMRKLPSSMRYLGRMGDYRRIYSNEEIILLNTSGEFIFRDSTSHIEKMKCGSYFVKSKTDGVEKTSDGALFIKARTTDYLRVNEVNKFGFVDVQGTVHTRDPNNETIVKLENGEFVWDQKFWIMRNQERFYISPKIL